MMYYDWLPCGVYHAKARKTIKRGQVCPVCGRKRINTYLTSDRRWLCRICRDTFESAKNTVPIMKEED